MFETPENKIAPKISKEGEKSQAKKKLIRMIRRLNQRELNEVEAFILELKAKRS